MLYSYIYKCTIAFPEVLPPPHHPWALRRHFNIGKISNRFYVLVSTIKEPNFGSKNICFHKILTLNFIQNEPTTHWTLKELNELICYVGMKLCIWILEMCFIKFFCYKAVFTGHGISISLCHSWHIQFTGHL